MAPRISFAEQPLYLPENPLPQHFPQDATEDITPNTTEDAQGRQSVREIREEI